MKSSWTHYHLTQTKSIQPNSFKLINVQNSEFHKKDFSIKNLNEKSIWPNFLNNPPLNPPFENIHFLENIHFSKILIYSLYPLLENIHFSENIHFRKISTLRKYSLWENIHFLKILIYSQYPLWENIFFENIHFLENIHF